jgi:hypothetical protein
VKERRVVAPSEEQPSEIVWHGPKVRVPVNIDNGHDTVVVDGAAAAPTNDRK